MSPARIALITALTTLVLDQASKLYLLFVVVLPVREPIIITPFLEFIVVWNRGISYGLFQQNSDLGRWALVAVSIAASIGLGIWMLRVMKAILIAMQYRHRRDDFDA